MEFKKLFKMQNNGMDGKEYSEYYKVIARPQQLDND